MAIEHIENTTQDEATTPVEEKAVGFKKLDTPLKMKVLAMIARGEQYKTIVRILKEDHDVDYSANALSTLKKNNKDVVIEMERMILDAQASEADQIRVQALRHLNRKLQKVSQDEQELEALDEEYRTTDMSLGDYRRKKAGLLKMSVTELVLISKEMHAQSGKVARVGTGSILPTGNGQTDDSNGGGDPKFAEAVLSAIQRGDTISLQQMVINPNA